MLKKNNEKSTKKPKSYFKKLILVLMLVQILDSYATLFPGAIPSAIASEFLSGKPENVQNSIMAFASGLVTIGMMLLFFSQYLSDRLGRRKMLAITVGGMAIASLGMFLSVNFIIYMVFVFFLYFFFSSDIWLIYINEEVESNKRAFYSNIILMVGLVGAISMVICRLIFIREEESFWRGMTIFPMIIGFPLCILIFLTLKETSRYQLMKESGIRDQRSFKDDLSAIFKTENRKPYLFLLLIVFLRGGSSIYLTLFEKYIDDAGTLNQDQVTSIFFLTVFTVLIAYGLNGFADRIGRKPLLYLWFALAPISVLIWVFGAYNTENAYLIVMIGYALSHIAYWGSIGIIRLITIESLPTDRRGTGVGFRSFMGALGGTIGLLLSSLVILSVGLGITFVMFAMGNLVVIPLAAIYLKETKGVELSEIK
jgi:MHS family proline/betaine transporter-like MFS transporter